MDSVKSVRGATGLVYDDRMEEHRCLWDSGMPDCPERLQSIMERCTALQLVSRCTRIPARTATADEVLRTHSRAHYDLLASTAQQQDAAILEELSSHYSAVYLHPSTFQQSLLACGAAIELLDSILEGRCRNGMAIIRPPGHHATHSGPNGFCFFNNVAVAAQTALDRGLAKRILIVDWDVHHGQGIQRAFYGDDRVLYFSVHRHENGLCWPHLRESDFDWVGEGRGRGYNFNVALDGVGMQNGDYLAVWQQLLMPVAIEFQPDLVIVAAGFDAALGCPLGDMEVTPACYAHLIAPLMTLASGRVAVVLEGGYCLQSLAEGAALTLRTLLGDPCPPLVDAPSSVSTTMRTAILNCTHAHRDFWRSLRVQRTYDPEVEEADASDRHVVQQLYEWTQPVPERHATRNSYPTQSAEVKEQLAERLTALEERTDLQVAGSGVGLVTDQAVEQVEHSGLHRIAGNIQDAIDGVLRGQWRSAICTTDGVAAALVALRANPAIRKVLVVDWNGQQRSRESNPNVLYISLSECSEIATGSAFDVNIPWNHAGMGVAEYSTIFQRLIMPIAYEFGPDLVLVSVGVDPPGCDYRVTPEAFGHFTAWLATLARGKVVVVLQGDADVEPMPRTVTMCAKALLGDPLPPLRVVDGGDDNEDGILRKSSALQTLHRGWAEQAEQWKSLRGWNVRLPSGPDADETVGETVGE